MRVSDPRLFPFIGEDQTVVQNLRVLAKAFVQLQDKRHIADYDNATFWTQTEAFSVVRTATKAFAAWGAIKDENIAQEYLVSLLIKQRD